LRLTFAPLGRPHEVLREKRVVDAGADHVHACLQIVRGIRAAPRRRFRRPARRPAPSTPSPSTCSTGVRNMPAGVPEMACADSRVSIRHH
jgi:hypothetical protein